MAKDILGNKFIGAIVANKSDLDYEKVDVIKGKLFAKKHNYKFYLVSAKDNQQAFINCLDELVKDYILAVHPDLLTQSKNFRNKRNSFFVKIYII